MPRGIRRTPRFVSNRGAMLRISQRFAALFTAVVTALGFFAALPIPPSQRAQASNLPPSVVRTVGLARPLIASPPLHTSLAPGQGAAFAGRQRLATALTTVPDRLSQLPDRPFLIPGEGPHLRGSLVAKTERLDIYVGIKTFSEDQIASLAGHLEQILRDDEAWFGTRLTHRISIGFYRPSAAEIVGSRGIAYTDQARAEVYFAEGEDLNRAFVVAAHELGHHLEEERYGTAAQKRADTILHEGLATWITGKRWVNMCGAANWKERGRQLRDQGIPLRLLSAEQYGANNAYELWASFTHYLAHQYGWKKFDELYASGTGRAPGSANYQGVLGKSLDELAADWRAWLAS